MRRALCIGINYVGLPVALNGCINDQENVAHALRTKAGFKSADIVMMNDNSSSALKPTYTNIWMQLNALAAWATQAKSAVQLFVSYSGHGTYRMDTSRDDTDRRDEAIVPLDYRTTGIITDDMLRQYFIERLPANATLFLMVDACNSGTIADLRYGYNTAVDAMTVSVNSQYAETACQCISLSACLDLQLAADVWLPDPVTGVYEAQGGLSSAFCTLFSKTTPIKKLARLMRDWVLAKKLTQLTQLSSSKPLADEFTLFN
jgi:hypothetical protein